MDCLIQVADHDEYISKQENETFIGATPNLKTVKHYDAKHELGKAAQDDRKT